MLTVVLPNESVYVKTLPFSSYVALSPIVLSVYSFTPPDISKLSFAGLY